MGCAGRKCAVFNDDKKSALSTAALVTLGKNYIIHKSPIRGDTPFMTSPPGRAVG